MPEAKQLRYSGVNAVIFHCHLYFHIYNVILLSKIKGTFQKLRAVALVRVQWNASVKIEAKLICSWHALVILRLFE